MSNMFSKASADYWAYGFIGGLTAAQTYVASGDLPHHWGPWIGITLAALVALKAKRSGNGSKEKE